MIIQLRHLLFVPCAAMLPLIGGCQSETPYETNRPVIEEDYDNDVEDDLDALGNDIERNTEELGENIQEGTEDAIDAVTPDRPIVDIESPLGDVEVGEDPITGDKNVDVDVDGDE
jgi:hypothetical protein